MQEAAPVTVSVNDTARRAPPRFGFGNELVLQSTNDSQVAHALAGSGGTISRYPGGTPSDYWLWSEGWVNMTSHHPHSSQSQPLRQTTPEQWRRFLDEATIRDSVLDLCQLTCELEYELSGLRAHEAAGTPVRFVELGNEMYDGTRSDVVAKYPRPSNYSDAMVPWVKAIKAEWPNASVALIGMRWNPEPDNWNKEVLFSPAAELADAVTLHIYCGWDADDNSTDQAHISQHLAQAAMRAFNNGDVAAGFPNHLRVWVTEMGVYPAGALDSTWLHAMFYCAMDLQLPATIPTMDVLMPYCFLCSDPTAPSFTTAEYGPIIPPIDAGTVPVVRRLSGEIQAQLFLALRGARSMAPLVFSVNPILHRSENRSRTLLGWQVEGSLGQEGGVILNQGSVAVVVDLKVLLPRVRVPSRATTNGALDTGMAWVNCTFPATSADVVRAGMSVGELNRSSSRVRSGSSLVTLPPYSLCVSTSR